MQRRLIGRRLSALMFHSETAGLIQGTEYQ